VQDEADKTLRRALSKLPLFCNVLVYECWRNAAASVRRLQNIAGPIRGRAIMNVSRNIIAPNGDYIRGNGGAKRGNYDNFEASDTSYRQITSWCCQR